MYGWNVVNERGVVPFGGLFLVTSLRAFQFVWWGERFALPVIPTHVGSRFKGLLLLGCVVVPVYVHCYEWLESFQRAIK